MAQLSDFFIQFSEDWIDLIPIKTNLCGTLLQFDGSSQAWQANADTSQCAIRLRVALLLALRLFYLLPAAALGRGIGDIGCAKHMRMTPDHLVGNRCRHCVEVELTKLLSHLRIEHDLEQQISELILEVCHISLLNRINRSAE